ncbi:hypothetical protein [Streptomyces roseoviridis]|uniref:Serine/threonine protein kinase n=1 Tax=Streptomyces roseoviridis TaxID=67361 RepID=A0ABV5QL41_9ACTN
MSPAKLRGLGLGAAVVIAVLVPIAATAGPAGERPPGRAGGRAAGTAADLAPDPAGVLAGDGAEAAAGGSSGGSSHASSGGPSADSSADSAGDSAGAHGDAKPKGVLSDLGLDASHAVSPAAEAPSASDPFPSATRCGPELASPDGVEAQTCVVTEGADTWARTYYRNTTGQRLDAVLTLMAPGGRTVQVRCAVEARDEPGTCETPRERGRGAVEAYSAVSEFAGAGEGGSAPLLLRSGSNAPESDGS